MKKFLKLILCITVMFMVFSDRLNASGCSENGIKEMVCNSNVKSPTTGIIGALKCSELKPTKVYYKKYSGGSRAFFACYYSESDGAYFYIQYEDNGNSCKVKDSVFIKKGSNSITSGNISVTGSNSCAEYFYIQDKIITGEYGIPISTTHFYFTDKKNDELEKDDATDTNPSIDISPDLDISGGSMTCSELLGSNLTKIVKLFVNAIRFIGVIIAIIIGMTKFVPVLSSDDPHGTLKKAFTSCIKLVIALVVLLSFPVLVKVIGKMFDFDLSCFF